MNSSAGSAIWFKLVRTESALSNQKDLTLAERLCLRFAFRRRS